MAKSCQISDARRSRILLVSSNDADTALWSEHLSHADRDIATARDGEEALERAAAFQPDVILLETILPGLSGFEVCKRIKEDPATSGILILMVTALNELRDIERVVAVGTDDFLSKPVNRIELARRVENLLNLRRRRES